MLYFFLSTLLVTYAAASRFGVDLSVASTTENWKCLMTDHNTSFGIVRAYRSVGAIDENSANSLKNAYDAGLTDLHAYIFPCVSSSSYSVKNNIKCELPSEQLKRTVQYLEDNNINVVGHTTNINVNQPSVGILWLDIEDEDPSKYYDVDITINQNILSEFVTTANELNVNLGIYTTKTYWTKIMGGIEGYSQYPLWYPRYDGVNSMDFFTPFAGWDTADIKQTNGDVSYCGVSQVDSNYMEY